MSSIAKNISRLQKKMTKSHIDAILIPLGINFRWLFNLMEEPSERAIIAIIYSEESPKLLVPRFELNRMKMVTEISDCVGWEETQDPYEFLLDLIPSKANTVIGIEPKMWFSVFQNISNLFPEAKFLNIGSFFDELRAIKDQEELKFLIKASQKSGEAIINTLNELEVGITETEVTEILLKKLIWGAREKAWALVQFGENTAFPHYHGGGRKLKRDDVVLIDAGGSLNNYWGDITITTVFGKASKRFKEIYDVVFVANKKGKESVVQNKLPSEIDDVTRSYITKKGYGNYFTHRTGHGIGLEVHEHPYISKNNHKPLIPGNVFSIEPGIYLEGEFGVRIEDNVIKTSHGIDASEIPRYELLEI